jgi:hypothetical protein
LARILFIFLDDKIVHLFSICKNKTYQGWRFTPEKYFQL